jgi:putative ABC transport system ATP-binding protein
VIRLEEVSRVFGSGPTRTVALEGVSLAVERGEFVAIAGPSGSGKTTLLNLIGAMDDPTSGAVRLRDRDLGGLSDAERAELRLRHIGFVFQHFNLIPVLSAAENVEFPLLFRSDLPARERRERTAKVLERVGLGDKAARRPAELSGGERQRIAVARALAGGPDLVLADEPTASLDHETGRGVIELMRELNRERGTTFLYATHDAELLRLADRVVRLRDGRIVTPSPRQPGGTP